MYLGRVVGRVWSTVKDNNLSAQRLLIVQPLSPQLEPTGKQLICADCTGAGAGELVYWCRGKEASFPFLPAEVPTDCTIVGIVDSLCS
jgi:ethanolamine utilization protein EutN